MGKVIKLEGTNKNLNKTLVKNLLTVVDKGLVNGLGNPVPGEMCVEAAVCYVLGLPHGDDPKCVGRAVRTYKIRLNDSQWGSHAKRAAGMRRLAVAQLGSNTLDQIEFAKRLALGTVNTVLAEMFKKRKNYEAEAECRKVTDLLSAKSTARKYAAYAAYAAAAAAADALSLSAEMTVRILIDMNSPGVAFLPDIVK